MYNLNVEQISNIGILIELLKNDVTDEQYDHYEDHPEKKAKCALAHAVSREDLFGNKSTNSTFGEIYNNVFAMSAYGDAYNWKPGGPYERVTRTMVIERLESILKDANA